MSRRLTLLPTLGLLAIALAGCAPCKVTRSDGALRGAVCTNGEQKAGRGEAPYLVVTLGGVAPFDLNLGLGLPAPVLTPGLRGRCTGRLGFDSSGAASQDDFLALGLEQDIGQCDFVVLAASTDAKGTESTYTIEVLRLASQGFNTTRRAWALGFEVTGTQRLTDPPFFEE